MRTLNAHSYLLGLAFKHSLELQKAFLVDEEGKSLSILICVWTNLRIALVLSVIESSLKQ